MADEWWRPLRDLNDRYFPGPSAGVRWDEHVDRLNRELALTGDHELSTFPKVDLPPAWFIGDVTSVVPGEWVLVFSLNPAADNDAKFYAERTWDAGSFWEYQTGWLRSWWNRAFHGPLASLAARCIRHSDDTGDLKGFAASSIVFAELCPYASRSFSLTPDALRSLREKDIGCRVEAEMTEMMLRQGAPRLLLVNGNRAIEHFELSYGEFLSWEVREYVSEARVDRKLWHMQGALREGGRSIPVLGFPFLRKPRTHNATVEIEQLGRYGADLVGALPGEASGAG